MAQPICLLVVGQCMLYKKTARRDCAKALRQHLSFGHCWKEHLALASQPSLTNHQD